MEKLTETYSFRGTKTQKKTLEKLDQLGFCVSKFIRLAIREKINRDVKKERKLPLIKIKERYF